MSGRSHRRLDGGIEYELHCDRCGAPFLCGDDSYYSWPVLCTAAEAEGWRVGRSMDGGQWCRGCAHVAPAERLTAA